MIAKRSFHIEAPVDAVFDFFKVPANWRDIVMFDMYDAKVTKDGVGTQYSWRFKVAGIPFEGFDVFTGIVPKKHLTERSSSGFFGTWDYTFEPEGSGTKLTIEITPASLWRFPVFRSLHALAMSSMGDTVMPRFKAKIESMVKPTTKPKVAAVS